MKTLYNLFQTNLFCENRLIFQQGGPERTAERVPQAPKGKEKVSEQEVHEAWERIGQLGKKVEEMIKRQPDNENLKKLHEKLNKLDDKIYDGYKMETRWKPEKYSKVMRSTLDSINKLIATKFEDVRRDAVNDLTESFVKRFKDVGIDDQAGSRLVGLFSLLNNNEAKSYGDVTIKREGNNIIIDTEGKTFTYKIKLDKHNSWQIYDKDGTKIGRDNALTGLWEGAPKSFVGKRVERTKSLKKPAPEAPKPEAKPKEKLKEKVEEKPEQKLFDALQPIFKNYKTVPAENMKIIDDAAQKLDKKATMGVPSDNPKAYLAKSADGNYVRITIDGKDGPETVYYSIKEKRFAETAKELMSVEEKTEFPEDMLNMRPEVIEKKVAKKPQKPETKVIEAKERKRKSKEQYSESLIKWAKDVRKYIDKVLKKVYSLSMYRKLVANEKGGVDETKRQNLEKFRSSLRDIRDQLKSSPSSSGKYKKAIENAIASFIPEEQQEQVRKDIPEAPVYKPPKESVTKKPAEKMEAAEKARKAFNEFIKTINYTEKNVYESPPPKNSAAEVALVFGFPQDYESPVMKDKAGNKFYLRFRKTPEDRGGSYSVYVKRPGEDKFYETWKVYENETEFGKERAEQKDTKEVKKGFNPMVKEGANKYIGKVIDSKTFTLKGVKEAKIHDVLKTPGDAAVSVKITRKDGSTERSLYYPGDKTYTSLNRPGKKRLLIYNGDTVEIESVHQRKGEKLKTRTAKLSPREKLDINDTAKEIGTIYEKYKTMDINSYAPEDKKMVTENLNYISKMHQKAGTENVYKINKTATLKVFSNGTIYGSDEGRKTFHYFPRKGNFDVA